MPLIARDPEAHSTLPPGGKPSIDDAYLKWAREYVNQINIACLIRDEPEWADRVDPLMRAVKHGMVIKGGPLNEWQLTGHLFKWLQGPASYPNGITYQHRLRHVAIQFSLRPDALRAEADRYVETLTGPEKR